MNNNIDLVQWTFEVLLWNECIHLYSNHATHIKIWITFGKIHSYFAENINLTIVCLSLHRLIVPENRIVDIICLFSLFIMYLHKTLTFDKIVKTSTTLNLAYSLHFGQVLRFLHVKFEYLPKKHSVYSKIVNFIYLNRHKTVDSFFV